MDKSTSPNVRVLDAGTPLTISFDDCVRYHGRTSIGGAALGFRLMQMALADLSPAGPAERASIRVRTAFPGPGLRDAIEMVTRAVTRGAYAVDAGAAPASAPEAVSGRLWFEVSVGDRTAAYQTQPGAMSEEFIRLGRKSHREGLTETENLRWTELKEGLAAQIMATPADAVLARL